jgi:alkylation response protein AidB-like acyl-CoA dehydrogenase
VDTEAELLSAMNAGNGALVAPLACDDRATAKRLSADLQAFKAGIDRKSWVISAGEAELCGDAAFRRDLGVERRFRDAPAATAIEPTAESALELVARTPWRDA